MVLIRQHIVSTAVAIKVTGGRKNTRKKYVSMRQTIPTKEVGLTIRSTAS